MVLLLGGSGAGKTTFLNAVTGYEKADADIEIGSGNVYKDYERMKSGVMEEVKKIFRPEFINRVDEIVCFNKLSEANFRDIAVIMLNELKDGLADRGIALGWDEPGTYYRGDLYLGATVGRSCNRIARGAFVINGVKYDFLRKAILDHCAHHLNQVPHRILS